MKKMIHFFPDRDCHKVDEWASTHYWPLYKKSASEAGLEWILASHEAIDIIKNSDGIHAYLDGELLSPDDTFFNGFIYGLPNQSVDIWQQFTTFNLLEMSGYYMTIPPKMAALFNDKMARFQFFSDTDVKMLPCVRIMTGRTLQFREQFLEPMIENIGFPMIVKPSYWGMGIGVTVAYDMPHLKSILSLAGGCNMPMILQPFLKSEEFLDYRAYVIEGKIHTVEARQAKKGEILANVARGGIATCVDVPEELECLINRLISKIDLPYNCFDFFYDGKDYWFSEMEIDGGIIYEKPEIGGKILRDRFIAYINRHEKWRSLIKERLNVR
jgi:glutathione synthase/RimK-type ligase-like ATP-grasp enzyme